MATTIRNNKLFCLNCGGEFALPFPLPVKDAATKMKQFDALHKDCKQTWVEPQVDQSKPVHEKAMLWMANGERGMSSETIWHCFMGTTGFRVSHPYDPDDFKRCYKLLKAVPEWKTELHRLKSLSKPWSNLVDNWDRLTEMFERNEKENWENYKSIGMYEFMKSLIDL